MNCTTRDDDQRPIVIAHRGASGYRPEHTLESYRLAIRQGADFIEPDLVATRDGVLVARHENEISGTTDVARHPEFASRRTTKVIDGRTQTGWFTEDFTLAELKTLRARERIPDVRPASARFDGRYEIPTFAEILRLAKAASRDGRAVGVYPETKLPTYFASEGRRIDGAPIGVSVGHKLVETLIAEGFTDPRRVYIQSFEVANLLELKRSVMPAAGVEFPLVQLFGDLDASGPYDFRSNASYGLDLAARYGGLADIVGGIDAATRYRALATQPALQWMRANYATGIGPRKGSLLPRGSAPQSHEGKPAAREEERGPAFLAHALEAGLLVHPYTLRADEALLTRNPDGIATPSVIDEAMQLFGLGVHGCFIDQPDLGVAARDRFLAIGGR
ncbi:glycerophosphodiester phosphodiesterase family protein [Lysobacter yangpyeongensis]|uniref:glycerophosphodiester phosphodiesterase n=1 Tax=Lysobacter yangpyeongensis TaxID=346182 RepID=A0ABW0SJY0_9GAMM